MLRLTPINDTALLVSHEKAEELHEKRKCATCGNYPCTCAHTTQSTSNGVTGSQTSSSGPMPNTGTSSPSAAMRKFYGTVKIDPHGGAAQFSDVMTEVVNLLTANPGVDVSIKVDINAESNSPFDKNTVVRPVKANCDTLHFEESIFEP